MDRDLIIAAWLRGNLSLRAAAVLIQARLYADAVSRAYYAILHVTEAALLTKGIIEIRSHQSGGDLLNRHLVYGGELEREMLNEYWTALNNRTVADYNVRRVFAASDGEAAYQRAEAFTSRIHQYLAGQGFTDDELAVTLPEISG